MELHWRPTKWTLLVNFLTAVPFYLLIVYTLVRGRQESDAVIPAMGILGVLLLLPPMAAFRLVPAAFSLADRHRREEFHLASIPPGFLVRRFFVPPFMGLLLGLSAVFLVLFVPSIARRDSESVLGMALLGFSGLLVIAGAALLAGAALCTGRQSARSAMVFPLAGMLVVYAWYGFVLMRIVDTPAGSTLHAGLLGLLFGSFAATVGWKVCRQAVYTFE